MLCVHSFFYRALHNTIKTTRKGVNFKYYYIGLRCYKKSILLPGVHSFYFHAYPGFVKVCYPERVYGNELSLLVNPQHVIVFRFVFFKEYIEYILF